MNKDMGTKEIRNCPECNDTHYSYSASAYQPCPSCGTVFSKNGKDRRTAIRTIKSIPCKLYVEGDFNRISFSARITDISGGGAGISYAMFPLPQNAIVELEIVETATTKPSIVVWTNEISKIEFKSGLRFVRPIQKTSPSTV